MKSIYILSLFDSSYQKLFQIILTHFISWSIIVWLTSYLTSLDLTKQVNLFVIQQVKEGSCTVIHILTNYVSVVWLFNFLSYTHGHISNTNFPSAYTWMHVFLHWNLHTTLVHSFPSITNFIWDVGSRLHVKSDCT